MTERLLHVPHAFAASGNSLLKVISALSREHAKHGGHSAVILSDERDAEIKAADNLLVNYSRYCPRQYFTLTELRLDALSGLVGRRRPYRGRLFLPAIDAAARWLPDGILLYEGHASASIPYWRDRFPDIPLILYVHNAVSRSIFQRELAGLVRAVDWVVCVSESVRQELAQRLPGSPSNLVVVGNGVDTSFFSPATPCAGTGLNDLFTVMFAGQLAPHKGPHFLIPAVDAAQRLTDVPLKLRIVGSNAYDPRSPQSDYVTQMKIDGTRRELNIEWIPFVDHHTLRHLYRTADLVCVPSDFEEPAGMVVLEAMACGIPVITSGRGGLHEIGAPASLEMDPRDTVALAEKIADLASHPLGTRILGEASLRHANERSWTRTYEQLMEAFQRSDRSK